MARAYMLAGVLAMAAQAAPVVAKRPGGPDVRMKVGTWNLDGPDALTGRSLAGGNHSLAGGNSSFTGGKSNSTNSTDVFTSFLPGMSEMCSWAMYSIFGGSDSDSDSDLETDGGMDLVLAEKCGLFSSQRPTKLGVLVQKLSEDICNAEGSFNDFGPECADVPEALGGFLCQQAPQLDAIKDPVRDAIDGAVKDGDCTMEEGSSVMEFFLEGIGNPIDWLLDSCEGEPHPCFGRNSPLDLDDLRNGVFEVVKDTDNKPDTDTDTDTDTEEAPVSEKSDTFFADQLPESTASSVVVSVAALGLSAIALMA